MICPTVQALLDAFCIMGEKKQIDGLTITFVGDMLYGRTVPRLWIFVYALYPNFHTWSVLPAPTSIPYSLPQPPYPIPYPNLHIPFPTPTSIPHSLPQPPYPIPYPNLLPDY